MNQVGLTFLSVAGQVTALFVAGALLVRPAARRGPGAASFVALLALALAALVTPLAFVPRPSAWSWSSLGRRMTAASPVRLVGPRRPDVDPPRPSRLASPPEGPGLTLDALRRLGDWLGRASGRLPAGRGRGPGLLAGVVLGGVGVGSLHLLLGLWAVSRCRRRARTITDTELRRLFDSLRGAMGCRREIEIRESADVATAATVGWRRPVVLLSAEWRDWSDPERRAVLGHELAHIAGGHYPAGLVGRLAVVLHFYHPLAHWLEARLRLEHELAADAVGAWLSGGREPYLRVLSRMALRQGGRPSRGPARMFLPGRRTLIRRIRMLQAKEWDGRPAASRAGRLAIAGPLVVLALGIAGWPGSPKEASADMPAGEPRLVADPPARDATSSLPAPFDLSFIPPDAIGLVAAHPSAAFRRPGMQDQCKALQGDLQNHLPGVRVSLAEIEQISAGFSVDDIAPLPDAPHGKRIVFRGFSVRMNREFDWKGEVERNLPTLGGGRLEEVTYGSSVYYKVVDIPRLPASPGFLLPDRRTMVWGPEPELRRLIDHAGRVPQRPAFAGGPEWEAVERGLYAIAIDNRGGRYLSNHRGTALGERLAEAVLEKAGRLVLGVLDSDRPVLRVIATCEDPDTGRSVAQTARVIVAKMGDAASRAPTANKPGDRRAAADRVMQDLLRHLTIEQRGPAVDFRSEPGGTLSELIEEIL